MPNSIQSRNDIHVEVIYKEPSIPASTPLGLKYLLFFNIA